MKHLHTFESFLNEVKNLSEKKGNGEIAVLKSDKAKAEKIMADLKLDYEDVGPKDSSSMNYYLIPDTDWDVLNKIGAKVKLQSMTVKESINEAADLSPLDGLLTKNGWKEVSNRSSPGYPSGTIRYFDYENPAKRDLSVRIVDSPMNGVYVELYKDDEQINTDPQRKRNQPPKYIQTVDDLITAAKKFLNVKLNENFLDEATSYTLKDDSGEGRATTVLKLEPDAWNKVKHLFDESGRPISDEVKRIKSQGYSWDLYSQSYVSGGKEVHKIYGVSGDYTFGNAPTYYQQKYRGNKKAAQEVLSSFVDNHLK
jgi:hypothetical protein